MKTNLNEIAKECHKAAVKKGFWDEPREIGTLLMLVVSELSEALEADRHNRFCKLKGFELDYERCVESLETGRPYTFGDPFEYSFKNQVKDTFEDEIADTFIRLFDLVGHLGIDIDKHIELKMKYNETREYKHGKNY